MEQTIYYNNVIKKINNTNKNLKQMLPEHEYCSRSLRPPYLRRLAYI